MTLLNRPVGRVTYRFLLILLAGFGHPPLHAKPRVTITTQENGAKSEKEFVCRGRIYAYLTLTKDMMTGKHAFVGYWYRPDGRLQDKTTLDMELTPRSARSVGIYIQFEEQEKSIFDEFLFGGDYGAHQSPYHGPWTFVAEWDGKTTARSTFWVDCVD